MSTVPATREESWTTVLINGNGMNRIKMKRRHGLGSTCPECGIIKGEYHKLGCSYERSPCGKHVTLVGCDCPIREGEPV